MDRGVTMLDETVHCAEVLLRGVRQRQLVWDADLGELTVSIDAFRLRPSDSYLSVDRNDPSSVDLSFERWDSPTFLVAAVSLHTGRVRSLSLRVEGVPEDNWASHAGVFGLPCPPFERPDDEAEAFRVASDLQEMSRFVACRSPENEAKARRKHEETHG